MGGTGTAAGAEIEQLKPQTHTRMQTQSTTGIRPFGVVMVEIGEEGAGPFELTANTCEHKHTNKRETNDFAM